MKKMYGVIAVAAMALTGCGNLCEDIADTFESVAKKGETCPSNDPDDTIPSDVSPTEAQINQCNEAVEKGCTDADRELIEKAMDCLNDLPQCTAANETAFQSSIFGCYIGLAGVSEACLTALSGTVQ
ncbi:hypothetical protein [Melittangium boletus]|uniref:Lipoprotein n=1 Tax=Melittangium boletus DSM 14713 TaxID=1294270 RepID=A0A250IK10_9BACT|nr:hypothetical protein [Melittangium boletus]ATB31550.1 hypothetical protein MEBOL_005013 [Melittangium boletus DSM 14713]